MSQCPKVEQYAAITPQRYRIGCQLLLIANTKSHTGFRLLPTSMTLNDPERRNSPYFAFSPNLISLLAKYVTVVEYRPIMSIKYIVFQFPSSTVGHNWLTLQRGLSAIAELLVTIGCDNSATVRDRFSLLLITNRKSHTGFPLVPTSMTLNSLERHNSFFVFFTEFDCFVGQIRHSGWI